MKENGLVLFSGGLDSTTCLYIAKEECKEIIALSFDYAQRHRVEISKAKKLAKNLGIIHKMIKIDPKIFRNTSLVDKKIKVPKNFSAKEKVPNTYVPGRNILFLSYATSIAESFGLNRIYIGVNALDYSGYPDCRPEFIEAFSNMIQIGTKTGEEKRPLQIITPLINMSKKEIVLKANELGVPFSKTHSCYDPQKNGNACGKCDSCLLRQKGFLEAGVLDK
jgi:7-cyano-7-deazaguanine synthase